MFQIDEKVIADSRTLITIQNRKDQIDALTKNGTLHYTMDGHNVWLTTPKVRKAYIAKQTYADRYDKVVLARDGVDIDGNYSFDGPITFKDNVEVKNDLIVRGNLTVEGESTIIDTPRLTIEDNIIELNKNEIGNGITLKNSGVAINRGEKEFARSLYNEDNKAFVWDTNSNMDAPFDNSKWVAMAYTENNDSYVAGDFRARYRLSAPYGKFTDSLSVANQTTLNNLTVAGSSVFNGPSTNNDDLTANGILTANGSAIFNNLLTANKVANFKDNVNIDSVLTVKGSSVFEDITIHKQGVVVESEGANITGYSSIFGTLEVSDNVTLNKDLTVKAKTTTKTLEVTDDAEIGSLLVNYSAEITNDLTANNIEANQTITAQEINATNRFSSTGRSTFSGSVLFDNNTSVLVNGGQFTANGPSAFNGETTFAENAVFNKNVNVENNIAANGSISGDSLSSNNNISIGPGDGYGLRFSNSDNYKIYMSSSQHSSGGRLDSTSDYNMYFNMSAGTNRGFIFKNNNTSIFQIEGSGQVRTKGSVIINGHKALTAGDTGHKNDDSGIDADKLDGLHATDFIRRDVDSDTSGSVTFRTIGKAIGFSEGGSIYKDGAITVKTDNAINNGFKVITEAGTDLLVVKDNVTTGLTYKNNKVWHQGNHGHNSGMNADLLDGKHASSFALANHTHEGIVGDETINLKGKYKLEYNEEFDSLDFIYVGDNV